MSRKLPSGHGWAYFGVVVGLLASLTMNVASTVLAISAIPLQLRVPIACAWPVFVYIGIEVLTRIEWNRGFSHWFARLLLLGPMTGVAIVVSYLHGRHVLTLAGEHEVAVTIGPLAVDATVFGCTVALLVTRRTVHGFERKSLAERVAAARQSLTEVAAAATGNTETETPESVAPSTKDDVDRELEAILNQDVEVIKPRSPRPRTYTPRGSWDIRRALDLIADEDLSDQAIADEVGTGVKGIQRARRGYRHLRSNPTAAIPAEWKVPTAVADVIREMVRR